MEKQGKRGKIITRKTKTQKTKKSKTFRKKIKTFLNPYLSVNVEVAFLQEFWERS